MRAVVLHLGKLTIRQTPDPVPGEGQLLVRTLACAICASDVHYMDHPDAGSMFVYDANRDTVMGHEFVGEVVAHGPDCSDSFPIGTKVTSMPILLHSGGRHVIGNHPDAPGGFGELMLVSERMARAVPDNVSLDAVACVDAFAVGEFYVRASGVSTGDPALVIGAGAIGLSAVAALRARGAAPIVVSDRNPERLAYATVFGADVIANPSEQSPFELLRQATPSDRRAAVPATVIECVGAPGLIQSLVDECDQGTKISAAGGWYSEDAVSVKSATHKGVNIQFGGGPHPSDWYGTLEAVIEGRLDPSPAIGRVIGLDDVPAALDDVRQSEGPPRIVVHPNA